MKKLILNFTINIFLILLISNGLIAASFEENIKKTRSEINKDNLTKALKILENIKISN